jgi:predicted trehalose synthase
VEKNLTTEEMGYYLVLRLCFSEVSADNNLKASFRTYINDAMQQFSEKYVKAKLLDGPIEVDPEDCLSFYSACSAQ